jgi:hypothetical protein
MYTCMHMFFHVHYSDSFEKDNRPDEMISNCFNTVIVLPTTWQFAYLSVFKIPIGLLLHGWFKFSSVNCFCKTAHWELNILSRSCLQAFEKAVITPDNCFCHARTLINSQTVLRAISKTLKIKDFFFAKEMRKSMPYNNCFWVYLIINDIIMTFPSWRLTGHPVSLVFIQHWAAQTTWPTMMFRLDP